MQKQVITQASILKFLKKGFKNKIIAMIDKAPLSKQMTEALLLNPKLNVREYFNEYFNELLEEKKIFEIGKHYCLVSKTEQPFYGTEKLATFFNSLKNGK